MTLYEYKDNWLLYAHSLGLHHKVAEKAVKIQVYRAMYGGEATQHYIAQLELHEIYDKKF